MALSDPQIEIYNSDRERNLFMSGQGGGKSWALGMMAMKMTRNYPEAIGLIAANAYRQLTTATMKRLCDMWATDFNMYQDVHYVINKKPKDSWPKLHPMTDYDGIMTLNNGGMIYLASLENYQLIDGIEVSWAMLDETKDTREEAVKDVIIGRLRQKALFVVEKEGKFTVKQVDEKKKAGLWKIGEGGKLFTESGKQVKSFNPLYIFTSPAKVDWINEWFDLPNHYAAIVNKLKAKSYFVKEDEYTKVVCSTMYSNQANLPDGYIDKMLNSLAHDPHKIDRLIYGSPVSKQGGEFYHEYEYQKHVKKCEYDPNLALHFFFDFNVIPYLYCGEAQVKWVIEDRSVSEAEPFTGYEVRFINEHPMEAPDNSSEATAERLRYEYREVLKHLAGTFIYGDASGRARSTQTKDEQHNYDIIEQTLGRVPEGLLNPNSNKVLWSNPSVVKRADFVNKMLYGGLPVRIVVDPKCVELITDLTMCVQGPDGGKRKIVAKDSTGNTYQKNGHAGDAMEYFLASCFEDLFD